MQQQEVHEQQQQAKSPTKSSSSLSSASSELMSSYSSNGSLSTPQNNKLLKKSNSVLQPDQLAKLNFLFEKTFNKTNPKVDNEEEAEISQTNNMMLQSLCSNANDVSFLRDGFPFPIYDNNDNLNNYEYCSFESTSSSTNTQEFDASDIKMDETTRNVSKNIRIKIEKLILSYKDVSNQTGKVHFINDLTFNFDENFVSSLFEIFFSSNYKVANFRQIHHDLVQSHVIKNIFLVLAKLGHECFKLNLLSTCEYLLEFALCRVDTNSHKLKVATLSTLSACYWRQTKFIESIECMNNEIDMIDFLSQNESDQDVDIFYSNKYRIFGNMASAYQRINKLDECLNSFQLQLNLAIELNDIKLVVNTLNSIGLVHNRLKDYENSLECFEKSLEILENSNLDESVSNLKLKAKQYNLIAEAYLKVTNYDQAKEFFLKELEMSDHILNLHFEFVKTENSNSIVIEDLEQFYLNLSIVNLNLGFVFSKLKVYEQSIEFYDKSLTVLNNNLNLNTQNSKFKQQLVEIYGRVYIGLVNGNLQLKDNLHALLFAHTMLDFTLKEMVKLNMEQNQLKQDASESTDNPNLAGIEVFLDQRFKYLKYLEMSACSKLATCYAKQSRLNDAYKLYQREAALAVLLNNILHLTRAYSHMAQIDFVNKNYEQCIDLYKQILNSIEQKLLKSDDEETDPYKPKDERLIQMIYYTLSNIGLCMEMLNKNEEALLMFKEQYEISKLLKNLKSQANALLNLVNIYLNKTRSNDNLVSSLKESGSKIDSSQTELINLLIELNQVYVQLEDLNGQFFTSQCLAYSYHTSGKFKEAIESYLINIELGNSLKQSENTNKSIFNLSLCHKALGNYKDAYKYQIEYLGHIENEPNTDYSKFISLGLIADLLLEIGPISSETCQHCIQIHIDRLKIIKNSSENSDEKMINNENKCKLISDCLESIAKCYNLMNDYQQVLKFKLLQLELQSEIEATLGKNNAFNKQKCRLLLDIGNMLLFKFEDSSVAFKYFEQAFNLTKNTNDLLLESIILGNMGLCKQKFQDYHTAIEFYKKQIFILNKRLNVLDRAENNISVASSDTNTSTNDLIYRINSDSPINFSDENIEQIKEICSIRIDIGRSYAKLGKCTELLSEDKINTQAYLNDALNYYQEYCRECEYLFEKYVKSFFIRFNESESSESGSEKSIKNDLNPKLKDLCDQIYLDYDISISKLAKFTSLFKPEKSIKLNEKRVRLLSIASEYLLNSNIVNNLNVQIFYELALLHSRIENNVNKSLDYCSNVLKIFNENKNENLDEMYLIEALNLNSDLRVVKFWDPNSFDEILSNLLEAYKLAWKQTKKTDGKTLELKYETMCRLCSFYRLSGKIKECLEILMDSLNKFTLEFQKVQETLDETQVNKKSHHVLQYIEYLFLIHRKIALIHLNHSNDSQNPRSKQILFLALKHVNEALMYLNYLKEFEPGDETELRQASVYFLFGKCHKNLKNSEMELEMFANSLDIYENLIQQTGIVNEIVINDGLLTKIDCRYSDEVYESFRLDFDEETRINYNERIDHLYQYIEDALIRMNKHKEAILVTERHRNKISPNLNGLQDLLNFDQIEKILSESTSHYILYYSRIEISQTLNCWFLSWSSESNCSIKFHQISYKSFDSLFLSKIGGARSESSKFIEEILKCDLEDQNVLLHHLYNLLIRPFEDALFTTSESTKSYLSIIMDQSMLKFPFHLIKYTDVRTNQESHLFELFEIDCVYSLKYLIKTKMYNHRYTKHQNDYSFTIPMKVIANDADMERLTANRSLNRTSQYQFDLILYILNPENKSLESINNLINTLMSKKIAKSVLLEFNLVKDGQNLNKNPESAEQNARGFLKKLYSKMLNRTTLNSTLVFNTLKTDDQYKSSLLNYLLFGNLGVYQLQNILSKNNLNRSAMSPSPKTLTSESSSKTSEVKSNEESNSNKARKEKVVDDVLLELTQDSTEVSLSQVIIQFLKLNCKMADQAPQVLDSTIYFLNDLLHGSMINTEAISFINLYEKFSKTQLPNNIITSSRLMLKRLGFSFYIDKDGKYMVKLPSKVLYKKLNLIFKCFSEIKNFTSKFLKEFYETSKSTSGRELFILIKQHQTNLKNKTAKLILKTKTYKTHENFLKEFSKILEQNEKESKTQLEIEANTFNRIILLTTLILSESSKNDAEKSLEDFVDSYFKQIDDNSLQMSSDSSDEDLTSQYSTLSSIIGIQPQKESENKFEGDREIKIHREEVPLKINNQNFDKVRNHASRLHKMIEVNVDTQSETPYVYDKYLSELLENDLNYSTIKQQEFKTIKKENYHHTETKSEERRTKPEFDMFDSDFKCKNFIKLEEKEYMDQIITTTTTTVRTMTNNDLFMFCENNLNEISENPIIRNENFEITSTKIPINRINSGQKLKMNNLNQSEKHKVLNVPLKINEQSKYSLTESDHNIYHCLTNYTYEQT